MGLVQCDSSPLRHRADVNDHVARWPRPRSGISSRGRRRFAALLLAAAAWLAAVHARRVPAWEAPDEPWHLVYAEILAAGRSPSGEETYEAHHPPGAYRWLATAIQGLGWPPLAHAPYEPRFPLAPNAYLHGPPTLEVEARLKVLRALAALLALPGLALIHAAALRAGLSVRAALLALAAALLPPVLPATVATVNNDGAAFLAGAGLLYVALRLARPSAAALRRPGGPLLEAGGVALALSALALSKLNAWPLLPLLPAALVARGSGASPRRSWPAAVGLLLGGAALALCGLALISRLPGMGGLARLPHQLWNRGDSGALPVATFADDAWRVVDSALGSYGWQNLQVHPFLRVALLVLLLLWPLKGLLAHRRRHAPGAASPRIAALLLLAMALVFAAVLANGAADRAALQGRLLLPALPAWALLAGSGMAAGVARGPLAARRRVATLLICAPLAVQVLALGWILPQGMGDGASRPPGIVLRRTVLDLQPDLALQAGRRHQERWRVDVDGLLLERLELPVLASAGSGRLRLALQVLGDDAGSSAPAVEVEADLGSLGRAALNAVPRLGPLADTDWLGLDFEPPLHLRKGARLLLSVQLLTAGQPPEQGLRESVGWTQWTPQAEPMALLWTAGLQDGQDGAALLAEPEGPGGFEDAKRAIAWIAYGRRP